MALQVIITVFLTIEMYRAMYWCLDRLIKRNIKKTRPNFSPQWPKYLTPGKRIELQSQLVCGSIRF